MSVTRYTATPEVISGPRTRDRKALTPDEIGMGGLLKLANKLADMALIREYGKKALEEREAAVNERD